MILEGRTCILKGLRWYTHPMDTTPGAETSLPKCPWCGMCWNGKPPVFKVTGKFYLRQLGAAVRRTVTAVGRWT